MYTYEILFWTYLVPNIIVAVTEFNLQCKFRTIFLSCQQQAIWNVLLYGLVAVVHVGIAN